MTPPSGSGAVPGIELDTTDLARARASRDFGGLVQGRSLGVARPRDAGAVLELVRHARQRGLRLTPRGLGMSQSGQSVALDSVSVDLSGLSWVEAANPTRRTLRCGGGASWRAVLAQATAAGLVPKVMPLNLEVSVGGTLSAGGCGSTSHVAGFAVSNIASAQVVLGRGEALRCSPSEERSIYDAVFGGVGRAGIITEVELQLAPLKRQVRTCLLRYTSVRDLLRDQALLTEPGRADHVEGFCSSSMLGFRKHPSGRRVPLVRWSFVLQVSRGYDDAPPSADELCEGLASDELLHVEDDDAIAFAARYDGRFEMMRSLGAWEQHHPWLELFLPASSAQAYIEGALEQVPSFLGDLHRILAIHAGDRPSALAIPEGSAPLIAFAILPMGVPPALIGPAQQAIGGLHDLGIAAGGKRYLSGWLPNMNAERWQQHYGADYARLVESQRVLDPSSVFVSALPGLG